MSIVGPRPHPIALNALLQERTFLKALHTSNHGARRETERITMRIDCSLNRHHCHLVEISHKMHNAHRQGAGADRYRQPLLPAHNVARVIVKTAMA